MSFRFLIFVSCLALCCGFPAEFSQSDWLTAKNETRPRIIGGSIAQIWEHSYQGFLARKDANGNAMFSCGCSLIHFQWALSAAHCTYIQNRTLLPASSFLIGFGSYLLTQPSNTRQLRDVQVFYNHEDYDNSDPTFENDITIMKLSSPVTINGFTTFPISLPSPGNQLGEIDQSFCYTSGWGLTEAGQISLLLRSARVPLVTNSQCQKKYDIINHPIYSTQICTGLEANEKRPCSGDSGGPLACSTSDGRWVLIGITSFGPDGCSGRVLYSVNTRVSSYVNWIRTKIIMTIQPDPVTGGGARREFFNVCALFVGILVITLLINQK